jgi:molybdenum cofactor synthesis domain-containing protein
MDTTAGIVIIGDEILTGKFADQNAQFLIGELRALGVDLRRITVIPDDELDIAETVRAASERFDIVFTSGGVGPTHDDVTMAGIARGFGTTVVIHPVLEKAVRDYWGAALHEANIRLAQVPEGAELVYGTDSRWPVVCFRNIYVLPGVPALFKRKFLEICDRFRSAPVSIARVFSLGDEGQLTPHLNAVVAAHPQVKIGSYPRFDEKDFRVILTLEHKDATLVVAASADLVVRLGELVVRVEEATRVGPNAGR